MPRHSREIWKDVTGYEGRYQVSNMGRIRSLSCILKPQRLKPYGYCIVNLYQKGKMKSRLVHRLVLTAFVGPCPKGMEACHFPDRNPANNRLENLRWDTPKNNCLDQKIHGTKKPTYGNAKMTVDQVREARSLYATGRYTYKQLASRFGVAAVTMDCALNKRSWKHI